MSYIYGLCQGLSPLDRHVVYPTQRPKFVVALQAISIADHDAQWAECDVRHLGPSMVGDGGAKMLLDSIAEDLDRAYQALEKLQPLC